MSRSTKDHHLNNFVGPKSLTLYTSFKLIGLLVPEKKTFEGVLPYMEMAAILVIWREPIEQTFVSPSHWYSTWNLASIGTVVSEEKIFENGGDDDNADADRRQMHAYTINSSMSLKPQIS